RAARRGPAEEATEALLRELLVRGEVLAPEPPLWRRPGFWVGILAAAAVAAGVTVGVLHEPPTRTEVTF
ncbi:MAG TPA: hypothetical protein RMG45_33290, partial [Polyangiaceae bacterium LLY-WYZ-15_(1-7)]|nr:hypothetical protein [Polyangiaceae bacterium LLY-WYZ-15_(1-7)]